MPSRDITHRETSHPKTNRSRIRIRLANPPQKQRPDREYWKKCLVIAMGGIALQLAGAIIMTIQGASQIDPDATLGSFIYVGGFVIMLIFWPLGGWLLSRSAR